MFFVSFFVSNKLFESDNIYILCKRWRNKRKVTVYKEQLIKVQKHKLAMLNPNKHRTVT